jgi:undecaprenyl-diphosphatase
VAGGTLVSTLLKLGFDRPRPDLVPHGSFVYTSSFPSGHSMMSAVGFLTLGALLAGTLETHAMRIYVIGLAVLLTAAVGVSRVYLGVHWPTDVLAGWAAGTAWALACWGLARFLRRRGEIE